MTDISKYNQPAAIPTMGAGSIALLIGPNAPVVFDQIRSSFFENAHDFFKPLKSKKMISLIIFLSWLISSDKF